MKPEQLTQALEEFKSIYKEEFRKDLSDEEALTKGSALLQLFDWLINNEVIQ